MVQNNIKIQRRVRNLPSTMGFARNPERRFFYEIFRKTKRLEMVNPQTPNFKEG